MIWLIKSHKNLGAYHPKLTGAKKSVGKAQLKHRYCRGIVTADVLRLGLSRGAIAARKLEGVNGTRNTRVILVRPLTVKVKAYVQLRWY